jgi:hypothetical protein
MSLPCSIFPQEGKPLARSPSLSGGAPLSTSTRPGRTAPCLLHTLPPVHETAASASATRVKQHPHLYKSTASTQSGAGAPERKPEARWPCGLAQHRLRALPFLVSVLPSQISLVLFSSPSLLIRSGFKFQAQYSCWLFGWCCCAVPCI